MFAFYKLMRIDRNEKKKKNQTAFFSTARRWSRRAEGVEMDVRSFGALTRRKMAKKAIRGVKQIEKKKIRWIDGNVFVIKFVFRYTCLIL